ncbi:MAG: branched-chain amino acid aminotransferase [Bacteroidia bacterium]
MTTSTLPISVRRSEQGAPSLDWHNLPFGKVFSPHMAQAWYENGQWSKLEILPFEDLRLHPATSGLHYGQVLFEGMKAFKQKDRIVLFRPDKHHARLNLSAYRLAMPQVSWEIFIQLLMELLRLDALWAPPAGVGALYVRPLYFATDPYVGIRASETYRLLIFTSPVGPYYTEPLKIYVEPVLSRSVEGGVGAVKMAGNYAATLHTMSHIRQQGYTVTLWLDGRHHQWVDEFSTMNVFFVLEGDSIVTPPLHRGTILAGVTRESILHYLREEGLRTYEREIAISEVVTGLRAGWITEIFGTGTAATIIPAYSLTYQEETFYLPQATPITDKVKSFYSGLIQGKLPDRWNWLYPVD